MTRKIDTVIVHCSATPPDRDVTAKDIDRWHRQRGFLSIGYHFVIRRDGTVETGRPVDRPGAHAKGHNRRSIGICLIGGVDDKLNPESNFTADQWESLEGLIRDLLSFRLRLGEKDHVRIIGHNEVSSKACPSFNVQEWLRTIPPI